MALVALSCQAAMTPVIGASRGSGRAARLRPPGSP